jgi:hypothetical protein
MKVIQLYDTTKNIFQAMTTGIIAMSIWICLV